MKARLALNSFQECNPYLKQFMLLDASFAAAFQIHFKTVEFLCCSVFKIKVVVDLFDHIFINCDSCLHVGLWLTNGRVLLVLW